MRLQKTLIKKMNYLNIQLSNTSIVLLGIISAIFMVVGTLIRDKEKNK